MIHAAELDLLRTALVQLAGGFESLPAHDPDFDVVRAKAVLEEAARRLQDNYPYHHPLYAGQMLKPPHPLARLAYALSLWINPNNHALDGGRASSALEKECIAAIAGMYGWSGALGHLTGGGTVANLEALWIASCLHPGKRILASSQAHYTHARLCGVLGLPFSTVRVDPSGRMDPVHLRELLAEGNVGTIVASIGTTGLGAVDPLQDILPLAGEFGVRVHADAAYGGYFGLTRTLTTKTRSAYELLSRADSIVVDPHKHGLQPYGCGCILFRDAGVGRFYKHDSPYTYFSSAELHLGEISLECSRPGAAAVALWATQQLLPLVPGGEFAEGLEHSLHAAQALYARLVESAHFQPLLSPELDIVIYLPDAPDAERASVLARAVFGQAAKQHLHLSLIQLPSEFVRLHLPSLQANAPLTTCLRSVLMKPEHDAWIEPIMSILESAAKAARA